ncbi:MAG: GNAT family N-acetyltransferase [Lachnospiraceae bacterium]|nr:GNAT family N-acetyltransferase [Lachnospiraceae bacterium]
MIRKATRSDLDAVVKIYDEIHQAEENGQMSVGWIRGIYPVRKTAEDALQRGDLFVLETEGIIAGAAIINQIQVDVYYGAPWMHPAEDEQVCVLHTLVISPQAGKRGLGRAFVKFYEEYAAAHQCPELRIDTNAINSTAREMYRKLGYTETDIVPTVFNGIPGVNLVLLEKWIGCGNEEKRKKTESRLPGPDAVFSNTGGVLMPEKKNGTKKTRKTTEKAKKTIQSAAEPEVIEKAAEEPVKEVVRKTIEEPVKETVKKTVKKTVKAPVKKTVEKAVKAPVKETVEKAVKAPVKETVEKAVEAPVKETVEKAVEAPVKETVEKAVEAPVGIAAEEIVEEPVKEAVEEAAVETAEVAEAPVEKPAEETAEAPVAEQPEEAEEPAPVIEPLPEPRRSIAFIGSECYPFVKTGGLGDVMYALPRELTKLNCDVKVILPKYKCIPDKYKEKMEYRGAFSMNLCADGRAFYVGIMEMEMDGVVYDFIDNDEFFNWGNPYTDLVKDIPKYCFFGKAALAALNYLNWIPDIIHCHDWQAGLVPVYLRTLFADSPVGRAASIITIHNLRFQGIYNIPTIQYWSGLPGYVFDHTLLKQNYEDANMFKGGLAYANIITTVSGTYAGEIQTPFYGEGLDAHLRFHAGKLRGIVNGIDTGIWNSRTDKLLTENYDEKDVLQKKRANKLALQERLGLVQDEGKMVIGLISRLTDQKGLDLVNAVMPAMIDGNTQIVILGTGDRQYEDSFRYYEGVNRGTVCAYIAYDESLAHQIYAGADALLVPSLFEPCGLTQLIAMRYGTVPIVRETGGLKDTVQPYNAFTDDGNGFTFDRYEAGLLLDAVNRAKTVYFTARDRWDEIIVRDMEKDVSWRKSAWEYRNLYLQLKP